MATRRRRTAPRGTTRRSRPRRGPTKNPRFVGRDPSPVLDRYPPREPAGFTRPPPPAAGVPPSPRTTEAPSTTVPSAPVLPGAPAPEGLIRLERPFDPDEFSRMLGETSIRLTVPRDALPEVLRRATEFMGFGIYVYAISVRPAPSELLQGFVVELQRVEYDPEENRWKPFVERGAVGAPP
ncbi:MAG TPA: hypothetical protein VMH49_00765 [Thermoplasmata archaeon]|nr:hypothetical protein [Thermoplasmata archaeon]